MARILSALVVGILLSLMSAVRAQSESSILCNSTTSSCFETIQFESSGAKFSLGFALPPKDSRNGEFVINASIPLPYGFVSFTMGNQSSPLQMAAFVDQQIRAQVNAPPLNLSDVRAQLSRYNGDDELEPFGTANRTVLQLSSRTDDSVNIIFRFQDSQLASEPIFSSAFPHLTATFSLNPPEYLDSTKESASLYINGSTPIPFILNATAARSSDYAALLQATRLNV